MYRKNVRNFIQIVHQQLVNVSRLSMKITCFTANLWNTAIIVETKENIMHSRFVNHKLIFKRLIRMSEKSKDIKMIDSSTSTTKKRNYAQVADFMG